MTAHTSTVNGRNILLIGSGRLAKHLSYWHSLNHRTQLLKWNRRQPVSELLTLLEQKPLVWLAISDSALAPFYAEHLAEKNLKVVHFSGAHNHPYMMSAHPLMSFTETLFNWDFYGSIHFTISGFNHLEEAMPGFKNSFSVIAEKDKAFYHALCVVAGNFPQMLWAEVFREVGDINIPPAAFETYIKKIAENFIQQKEAALTGPIIRRDLATINANLEALSRNTLLQDVYSAFAKEHKK